MPITTPWPVSGTVRACAAKSTAASGSARSSRGRFSLTDSTKSTVGFPIRAPAWDKGIDTEAIVGVNCDVGAELGVSIARDVLEMAKATRS